jgi:hypothetical protein
MAYNNRNNYGGIQPKSITARFAGDSLVSIVVVFRTKAFFDDLGAAMIAAFGEPTRRVRKPVKNRMGAAFENEELTWTAGGNTAILSKYAGTIEDGSVYIVSDKHLQDIEKKRQERRQKGVGNL